MESITSVDELYDVRWSQFFRSSGQALVSMVGVIFSGLIE
jgi:hypothetical protein